MADSHDIRSRGRPGEEAAEVRQGTETEDHPQQRLNLGHTTRAKVHGPQRR
jgi:hypothetical protein